MRKVYQKKANIPKKKVRSFRVMSDADFNETFFIGPQNREVMELLNNIINT